ncbi:MAG: hypothetical protein ACRDFS_07535 [Chloroflexota bacterium]
MRDVWKSGLEWYIYYADPSRKAKFAVVIMGVKDKLQHVRTKPALAEHYMSHDGICEDVVATLFPGEEWLDCRRTEDVAYGLRCLEISTGKSFDLFRRPPSRWLIETVA